MEIIREQRFAFIIYFIYYYYFLGGLLLNTIEHFN